jgi:hypothetical protein
LPPASIRARACGTQAGLVDRRFELALQPPAQPPREALEAGLVGDPRQQPGSFAQQPLHQLGILRDRDAAGDRIQRHAHLFRRVGARQRLDLLVLGAAQQGRRLGLVQHLEARGDAGLEREALQQRLAERVDGEDVDAARCIEHAGEQPPRQAALLGLRHLGDQRGDLLAERRIVGHRPAAELARQSIAHLRGRRLGEGEAKDALGPHAVEQQARHPIGQHLGLAGAGIGLDPGGMAGGGGAALRLAGHQERVEHVAHSSPPVVDHSATRSRCA